MEYRREIDGLRAVAILPVILVHTQFGLLPGGFTGVDVFFVISGYLITRILVADIEDGRFSAIGFYARGVRRLVPSLAVMLSGTALLAAHRWGDPAILDGARRDAPFVLDPVMAGLATEGGADYISQIEIECPRGRCRTVTADGTPYHFDFGHLTLDAAREMVAGMPVAKLTGAELDAGS